MIKQTSDALRPVYISICLNFDDFQALENHFVDPDRLGWRGKHKSTFSAEPGELLQIELVFCVLVQLFR